MLLAHTTFAGQTVTISNSAAITITDDTAAAGSTAATPYPSTITVSGVSGVLIKATVTLSGITESRPDDLDILLAGPAGQTLLLMSDAGGSSGSTVLNNVTLTFDDAAASSLPDSTRSSPAPSGPPITIPPAQSTPSPRPRPRHPRPPPSP